VSPDERSAYARGLREAAVLILASVEHRVSGEVVADELYARAEVADVVANRQRAERDHES